jgi:hypothetical protein
MSLWESDYQRELRTIAPRTGVGAVGRALRRVGV